MEYALYDGDGQINREGKKMRYQRGDINDTMRVAMITSSRNRKAVYVYATACGYLISPKPPAFAQAHYIVDGKHVEHRPT
jgi:hypothetical protein